MQDAELLTVLDVARSLRCSRAHVYNALRGTVAGVSQLPSISVGRRRLIRRCALERWLERNESPGDTIRSSPDIDAADV